MIRCFYVETTPGLKRGNPEILDAIRAIAV